MERENIMAFLNDIGSIFEESMNQVIVDDSKETPVLLMSGRSLFDDDKETGYSVMIESGENGYLFFQLLCSIISDVHEEKFAEVNEAIGYIAPSLTFGNFVLVEEGGMIIFRHCYIISEEADAKEAVAYAIRNLYVLESRAAASGRKLYELVKGSCTPEDIKNSLKG